MVYGFPFTRQLIVFSNHVSGEVDIIMGFWMMSMYGRMLKTLINTILCSKEILSLSCDIL